MAVTVITDKCKGCKLCVKNCPFGAIDFADGKAFINDKCTGCGACVSTCKFGAITSDEVKETKLKFENYGFDKDEKVKCTEIWSGREGSLENGDKIALNPHGCMCFEIEA